MRKAILIPALAVGGGCVGFALRWWELASAFEPETGLPVPFAPATILLLALSAGMALAFFLLSRGRHSLFPGGYRQAMGATGNQVYITATVLAAFLFLAAGVLTALPLPEAYAAAVQAAAYGEGNDPLLTVLPQLLLSLLSVATFVSALLWGRANYRGEGNGQRSLPLLVPAYAACLWLILAYQRRAGDPIVLDYLYELFAVIAALLGFYYVATLSFERQPKPRPVIFFCAMAVYFCLVTLADGHTLATTLFYLAAALTLLTSLTVLLVNDLRHRDDPAPGPQDGADPQETDIQPEKEASSDEQE